MVYILNFNVPKTLPDFLFYYEEYLATNIDLLFEGFVDGTTTWSVPRRAQPGDIVIFMCAGSARHNLGMVTSHLPASASAELRSFVDEQKTLYKQYSGCLLGTGIVATDPKFYPDSNWWAADIGQLRRFETPVSIDDFRDFITISRTNSVTKLSGEQWAQLKRLVNRKNPGFFPDVPEPDAETLRREFDTAVRKENGKTLAQLKKEAKGKSAPASASAVRTTVYHRDPVIAAYVKKRADGHCQLCGAEAPFRDPDGEPYLECHHIVWLSMGGMDSAENCAALCPNCHRRMHVLNDPGDVQRLKNVCRKA